MLGTAELLARLLLPPPRYHDAPLELDPELGFRGIPGFQESQAASDGRYDVVFNQDGMRGRELPDGSAPRPEGTQRVLFVGDSFLVGEAVRAEQLVTSRVEAELRVRGRDALAYNLSAIDWGTAQQLLALRRWGPALAPNAVVLFVYPANDLINNTRALAQRTTVSAGDPIRPYLEREGGELRVRYLDPWRAWLRRHSRLFAILERRVLGTRAVAMPIREDFARRLRAGLALREDFELFRSHRDPGHPWSAAWRQSFDLLRAFHRECDALGARLLVVVVPSAYQVVRNAKGVRLDLISREIRGVGLDDALDWNLPERRLARFFAQEGIEAVFLLGPLREAAAAGEAVFARDEHLTARGHEMAADEVVRRLVAAPAPASPAPEFAGAPVRILGPAADAQALLDFDSDRQLRQLGDGWISWSPARGGHPGGWLTFVSALAVLPLRDGDLVLRGRVPPQASLPITGRLQVSGGSSRRFRLAAHGRFTLRFPIPPAERARWPQSDGYIALLLAPGETHRVGGLAAGLVVEAVGFEPSASGAAGPALSEGPR